MCQERELYESPRQQTYYVSKVQVPRYKQILRNIIT